MRPPRPRPPRRRPPPRLLGLAARAAVLLGGVTLALKLALPTAEPPLAESPLADPSSGRGPPSTPPSAQASASGHETSDLQGGVLGWYVAALLLLAVAIAVGMVGLGRLYETWQTDAEPAYTVQQLARPQPPAPNLQSEPVGDLARQREAEDALLHTYAWIDPAHTRARIPIDRAMTLLVGKTLDPP